MIHELQFEQAQIGGLLGRCIETESWSGRRYIGQVALYDDRGLAVIPEDVFTRGNPQRRA